MKKSALFMAFLNNLVCFHICLAVGGLLRRERGIAGLGELYPHLAHGLGEGLVILSALNEFRMSEYDGNFDKPAMAEQTAVRLPFQGHALVQESQVLCVGIVLAIGEV